MSLCVGDYQVEHINLDTDDDWNALMPVYWDSWKDPVQAVGELTFAHLGTNTPDERASYEATSAAYLAQARENPDVHWTKVVDTRTNTIVGGGCWIHEKWKQPPPDIQATWFEEGSEMRELAEQMYQQLGALRRRVMGRDHLYGTAVFVLPEHRKQGAAMAVVQFGLSEAEKRGLELWGEGTSMSTPVYIKFGFTVLEWSNFVFGRDNPSPRWRRLVRDLQGHPVSMLWRPAGKQGYIEGKTVLPWLGRPRVLSKL